MAYFSNSTEGFNLEEQCSICKYGRSFCPIYWVQLNYNYDACNNETARNILDDLIKDDGTCEFFKQFHYDLDCEGKNVIDTLRCNSCGTEFNEQDINRAFTICPKCGEESYPPLNCNTQIIRKVIK